MSTSLPLNPLLEHNLTPFPRASPGPPLSSWVFHPQCPSSSSILSPLPCPPHRTPPEGLSSVSHFKMGITDDTTRWDPLFQELPLNPSGPSQTFCVRLLEPIRRVKVRGDSRDKKRANELPSSEAPSTTIPAFHQVERVATLSLRAWWLCSLCSSSFILTIFCFAHIGQIPNTWMESGERGVAHDHSRSPVMNEGTAQGQTRLPSQIQALLLLT